MSIPPFGLVLLRDKLDLRAGGLFAGLVDQRRFAILAALDADAFAPVH
jgi:hypothetical protein